MKTKISGILLLLLVNLGCSYLGFKDESLRLSSQDPIHFKLSDLDYVKQQLEKENNPYQEAYQSLFVEANKALNSNGYSVTTKVGTAPNGNKNAFVSRGRYWWPNPDTEDGLPYIHKDGEVNPEIYQYDYFTLSELKNDLQRLSITYYLTENEKFAAKAISLIHTWFIADKTKMNPHLKFAQGIPGHSLGRPEGIIDGLGFFYILDYITILKKSKHWTSEINNGVNNWYHSYYRWLLNHPFGESAKNKHNNHGTWYDVQVGSYAYYFNDQDKLREVLHRVKKVRIPNQIDPSGKQIHEIVRAKPLNYSVYNLNAFVILSKLADNNPNSIEPSKSFTSNGNNSNSEIEVKNAIDFILPYLEGIDSYSYEQMREINACSLIPILKWGYETVGEEEFSNTYKSIMKKDASCRESKKHILHPLRK